MPGRCLVPVSAVSSLRGGCCSEADPQHPVTPDLELERKAGCLMFPLLFSISLGLRPAHH